MRVSRERSRWAGWLVAPVVLVGLMSVAGCTGQPGVAAEVNGTPVRTSDIDLLAAVQCDGLTSAQSQQGAQALSTIRASAVSALVDATLSDQFAKSRGATYSTARLREQLGQLDQNISTIPARYRAPFRALYERYLKTQLRLLALGEKELARQQSGSTAQKPTDDAAVNAAIALRAPFVRRSDVTIDPAYSLSTDGKHVSGSGSLSRAVSSFAKGGDKSSPTSVWATRLPASQKCG